MDYKTFIVAATITVVDQNQHPSASPSNLLVFVVVQLIALILIFSILDSGSLHYPTHAKYFLEVPSDQISFWVKENLICFLPYFYFPH